MGIPEVRVKSSRRLPIIAGATLFAAGILDLPAHQTLYHNVELYLHDPKEIRVLVTVHAPELPLGVASGIDPSAVDEAWLRERSDEDLARLLEEAERFIRETFTFSVVSHGEAPLRPMPAEELPITFETREQIRDSNYDNGLPAGCFLATLTFPNPGDPNGLDVSFSPAAEKRLLLAVARPGEFPEVHDLEAAESVQIDLPPAPPGERRFPYSLVVMLSAVALFTWLASRRRIAR